MYNPANEISSLDFGSIIGGSLNAVVKAQAESANTTVSFIKEVGFEKKTEINEKGEEVTVEKPINVSFSYDKEVSPSQYRTNYQYSVKVAAAGKGYENENMISLMLDGKKLEAKINLKANAIDSVTLSNPPQGVTGSRELTIVYTGDKSKITAEARLILEVKEQQELIPAAVQKMQIEVPILTMVPIPFIKVEYADIDFNVKINSVSTTETKDSSNTDIKSNTSYKGIFSRFNTSLSASFSNQKSSNSKEEVKKDYSLNISIHAVQDDMPAGVSRILDMLEESIVTRNAEPPQLETAGA